jgi:hypothetical protein
LPSDDAEVYRALSEVFAALRVRWYLFGAQAAILHGAVRFTEDVDVTVELKALPTRALVDALAGGGFSARIADQDFIERTRVLPLLHQTTRIPVDVVLSGPGIEELFFESVVEREVDGVHVPVARAEDVVVMKVLAGRAKDLEDIVAILAAQGSAFDRNRTVELLTLLEQALDQRDLLPVFEQMLERVTRSNSAK